MYQKLNMKMYVEDFHYYQGHGTKSWRLVLKNFYHRFFSETLKKQHFYEIVGKYLAVLPDLYLIVPIVLF